MDQPRRTQAGQTGFLGHTPPTGGRPHNPAFTAGLMQAALQARKVMGIVTPLHDGYQVQTFHCSLAFGAGGGDKLRRLATELANAAGVPWCRISPYWDGHLIEIPKRAEDRRLLDPRALLEHEPPSRWHVPVGMGVTGEVVWHDLASPNMAHMVVGGESGSGKTVALHWLLFCLLSRNTPRQLQLLLCDPKLGELLPFQRVAHLVHPVEHRPREIAKLLEWAKAQMDERRAQVGDLDWRPSSRLLIVIDELHNLAKQDRRILAAVDDIAMLGRSLGVHLIITAQHPNARALGAALANVPVRLVGKVATGTLSYSATGRPRSMASMLLGNGDFLYICGTIQKRLQAPCFDLRDAKGPARKLLSQLPVANIRKLSLGEFVDLGAVTAEARGSYNRKALDLGEVEAFLAAGGTASQLRHRFGVSFERAQGIYSAFWHEDGTWPP